MRGAASKIIIAVLLIGAVIAVVSFSPAYTELRQGLGAFFTPAPSHQPDEDQAELLKLRADEPPEKYFQDNRANFDAALFAAAVTIHKGQTLTEAQLNSVKGKVNERVNKEMTLFFYAAYMRNLKAMGQLLDIGADPMLPMRTSGYKPDPFVKDVADGEKPLATRMLAILIQHGLDVNLRLTDEKVPLAVIVASQSNLASFKLLVDHGADVWAQQADERPIPYSAMTKAADMRRYEMIAYAIEKGRFSGVGHETIADLMKSLDCVWLRDDSISRALVEITRRVVAAIGYPGDEHSRYILDFGEKYFAGQTLSTSFQIENQGWPPFDEDLNKLTTKLTGKRPVTAADIEKVRAKINQRTGLGETLLSTAVGYYCDPATVDMLLAAGANPLAADPELIEQFIISNGLNSIEDCPQGSLLPLYFKYGGDPNARLFLWGSPLVQRAAMYEVYNSIQLLVEAGADPWARPKGRFERSAMETLIFQAGFADRESNLPMIDWLADKGVFRNAPPEPFAAFMKLTESRCQYYQRFGEDFARPLRKILADSGYKSNNACIRSVAAIP